MRQLIIYTNTQVNIDSYDSLCWASVPHSFFYQAEIYNHSIIFNEISSKVDHLIDRVCCLL